MAINVLFNSAVGSRSFVPTHKDGDASRRTKESDCVVHNKIATSFVCEK